MIEETKLSRKDLQECLIDLEGEKFLDAFCVIDWVNKTEKENKDLQQRIDKAIEYMKDFIFEPLLTNEDRKLIMYNQNLKKFEDILQGKEVK